MRSIPRLLFVIPIGCFGLVNADESNTSASTGAQRYTFSWPLNESTPAPRGGSTRGPPVVIDSVSSAAWRSLQENGLSKFERERRAILAMAGQYRVTFVFLEVETFKPGMSRDKPYQSWGTEQVFVDRDEGRFISLVHILDMRVIQPDGSVSEPMVTQHCARTGNTNRSS